MGHAAAEPVDLHHHLLQAGTRGPDQADRPVMDRVGEGQRQPADAPGSTVRSHHEQPALTRPRLSATSSSMLTLSLKMKAWMSRSRSRRASERHVLAGDRDESEVRLADDAHRALEGTSGPQTRPADRRRLAGEELVDLRDSASPTAASPHRAAMTRSARLGAIQLSGAQARRPQDLLVGRRPHHERHPAHTLEALEGVTQLHQPQRVLIRVWPDERVKHQQPSLRPQRVEHQRPSLNPNVGVGAEGRQSRRSLAVEGWNPDAGAGWADRW